MAKIEFDEARERLTDLVAENLGARLNNFTLVEENDIEAAFIVFWTNDREHGTHRAGLAKDDDRTLLVWGNYYKDYHRALVDFNERVAIYRPD